jgi:hypothetical protein
MPYPNPCETVLTPWAPQVRNHPAGGYSGSISRHCRRPVCWLSRAIGETMIVVMAAGLSANLTANPFERVTTVTVQIVTLLVGDQEFDSPKTLAAFALGLLLIYRHPGLNVIALQWFVNTGSNMNKMPQLKSLERPDTAGPSTSSTGLPSVAIGPNAASACTVSSPSLASLLFLALLFVSIIGKGYTCLFSRPTSNWTSFSTRRNLDRTGGGCQLSGPGQIHPAGHVSGRVGRGEKRDRSMALVSSGAAFQTAQHGHGRPEPDRPDQNGLGTWPTTTWTC